MQRGDPTPDRGKEGTRLVNEQADIIAVSHLIYFERHWRDTGQWDKMRSAYHPESVVRVHLCAPGLCGPTFDYCYSRQNWNIGNPH